MSNKSLATAADVRTWLVAHPKSFARLSVAARNTVVAPEGKSLRGRLHPEAFAAFNKGQRKAEYVLGATKVTAQAEAKAAAKARKSAATKAARKGATIGKRGPLPKAFRV